MNDNCQPRIDSRKCQTIEETALLEIVNEISVVVVLENNLEGPSSHQKQEYHNEGHPIQEILSRIDDTVCKEATTAYFDDCNDECCHNETKQDDGSHNSVQVEDAERSASQNQRIRLDGIDNTLQQQSDLTTYDDPDHININEHDRSNNNNQRSISCNSTSNKDKNHNNITHLTQPDHHVNHIRSSSIDNTDQIISTKRLEAQIMNCKDIACVLNPPSSSSYGPLYKDQVSCRRLQEQNNENIDPIVQQDRVAFEYDGEKSKSSHHMIAIPSLRKARDFAPSQPGHHVNHIRSSSIDNTDQAQITNCKDFACVLNQPLSSSDGPLYKDQVSCHRLQEQNNENLDPIVEQDRVEFEYDGGSNKSHNHMIAMSWLRKARDFAPSQRMHPHRISLSCDDFSSEINEASTNIISAITDTSPTTNRNTFAYETSAEIVPSSNEFSMINAIAVTILNKQHLVHAETPRKNRKGWYAIVLIFVSFVSIVSIIVLCADGSCRRSSGKISSSPLQPTVFLSKLELINAVDAYFSLPVSNQSTTTMAFWDVSNIEDFSSLFDSYRNPKAIHFNEYVGKWNMTSATNISYMFRGCTKFQSDLSRWNVANVVDMKETFYGAASFDSDLSSWDVKNAMNMTGMFRQTAVFRGIGLEYWNTSKLLHMDHMFHDAPSFNQNISQWDVSKVRNMTHLFCNASSFVGTGLRSWNTQIVEDMSFMFANAIQLTNTLGILFVSSCNEIGCYSIQDPAPVYWSTKSVVHMEYMFFNAINFDGPMYDWDVSNVISLESMFSGATSFIGSGLESWNTSQVTNMKGIFAGASNFMNSFYNASGFDTSRVTTMAAMFDGALSFNGSLSSFDVSRVEDMSAMFRSAQSFTGEGLAEWKTHRVVKMQEMFLGATSLVADLSTWDVSRVDDMSGMFSYATSFDSNLSTWDVRKVRDMSDMFNSAESFQGIGLENWHLEYLMFASGMFSNAVSFDADLSSWDMSKITTTDYMFMFATSFHGIGVDKWNTSRITSMSNMFYNATSFDANLSHWDVSQVTSMASMFDSATSFQGVGLDRWNTNKVANMISMFSGARVFQGNVSTWNVSSIDNLGFLFNGAVQFDGNLSGWDVSRVNSMYSTFADALSFHGYGLETWNISNVYDMSSMFSNARSLSADLSGWDVSSISSMDFVFDGAVRFDCNVSGWDVSNVWSMIRMFANAIAFHGYGLETWNTSNVYDMSSMFYNAESLSADLSGWDVSKVTCKDDMFFNTSSFSGAPWYS